MSATVDYPKGTKVTIRTFTMKGRRIVIGEDAPATIVGPYVFPDAFNGSWVATRDDNGATVAVTRKDIRGIRS